MFGVNRSCIFTVRDALNVCRAIDAENVGIAVDVYYVWWDSDLAASLAEAEGHFLGFHMCNWLENTSDMLLNLGIMGDGVADLKAIRAAVESAGYAGVCEVEIFSAQN